MGYIFRGYGATLPPASTHHVAPVAETNPVTQLNVTVLGAKKDTAAWADQSNAALRAGATAPQKPASDSSGDQGQPPPAEDLPDGAYPGNNYFDDPAYPGGREQNTGDPDAEKSNSTPLIIGAAAAALLLSKLF